MKKIALGWFHLLVASAVVAAFFAIACSITEPLPANAERFTPPAIYTRWWARTEACAGRTGDLASVKWYSVPDHYINTASGGAAGEWLSSTNRILVTAENIDNGSVVRHEMLHALLRVPGHPRAQFLGSCASVVEMGEGIPDGGRFHPPPGYLLLPTESLRVSSQAQLLPREADGQRWLAIHVSATNPRAVAVVAAVRGGPAVYATFTMRGPVAWSVDEADSSKFYFKPGETKEWLFESRVTSDLTLPSPQYHISPGAQVLDVGFGDAWAPWDTVIVSP